MAVVSAGTPAFVGDIVYYLLTKSNVVGTFKIVDDVDILAIQDTEDD